MKVVSFFLRWLLWWYLIVLSVGLCVAQFLWRSTLSEWWLGQLHTPLSLMSLGTLLLLPSLLYALLELRWLRAQLRTVTV